MFGVVQVGGGIEEGEMGRRLEDRLGLEKKRRRLGGGRCERWHKKGEKGGGEEKRRGRKRESEGKRD